MAFQAVYGIVSNRAKTESIIQALVDAGIKPQDISFLASQRDEFQDVNPEATSSNRNWRTEERVTGYSNGKQNPEHRRSTTQSSQWTDTPNGKQNPEHRHGTTQSGQWSGSEHQGGLGTEKHTKAPEGATTGGVAGGIIGGTLGLLAGIGALAIPGLGPFIAAGPLMATLAGMGAGGTLGGIVGALAGTGIPEYEAKRYENHLKQGGTLLAIRANHDDQAKRVKEIMQKHDAKDVYISSEATTSKNHKR